MEEEKKEPSAARYPLAYDANGDPLAVPADAVAWRVRRGGGKRGRPRNVFTAGGRQLEVPIAATIDELIAEGCGAGNYLLYPIDAAGRALPGPLAVTELQDDGEEETEERSKTDTTNELTALGHALSTVRAQSEALARALEATTRGYGPIHPPSSVLSEPLALAPPISPEAKAAQVMDYMAIAKMVLDVLRGAGIGVPSSASGTP